LLQQAFEVRMGAVPWRAASVLVATRLHYRRCRQRPAWNRELRKNENSIEHWPVVAGVEDKL